MAPKVKASQSKPSGAEVPPTVATTKKDAPKKKSKTDTTNASKKKENRSRGTAARNDLLEDFATTSELSVEQIKKAIYGLRTTVARNLKDNGTARIPTIMTLRTKTVPARDEGTKMICGVEKKLKARVEARKIMMSPLSELQEMVV